MIVNGLCWQVFWLGFIGLLDDRSSSLVKAKIFQGRYNRKVVQVEIHNNWTVSLKDEKQ